MQLIIDAHNHLYPCYDLVTAFNYLRLNLQKLAPEAVRAAFFTERSDCRYFSDIMRGAIKIDNKDFKIEPLDAKNGLVLLEKDGHPLYLFPGRQIVASERIEILALATDAMIPDFTPASDIINTVQDQGGTPVLSWAPGKWSFGRKKVVTQLMDRFSPGQMSIGDTTLRPTSWMQPSLMRKAMRKGFAILAGSDPLPFKNEEKYLGTYGTLFEGPFSTNEPLDSVRRLLISSHVTKTRVGDRCGLLETVKRLIKNSRAKNEPDD